MARRSTKRSAIPAPTKIVAGPKGATPRALRGRGVIEMTVADLVQRRWDAAKHSRETRDQWRGATGADINADIDLDRKTLIARARHEAKNNPNVAGAKLILGAHTVGRNGPTFQPRSSNATYAKQLASIVRSFFEVAGADGRGLVDHLVEAVRQLPDTGEVIWQIVTERKSAVPVSARIHPINPKYVNTPIGRVESTTMRLGVERTTTLKPVAFWVDIVDDAMGSTGQSERIAAESVIHYFRRDEAGQARGVPWVASSLGAASDLRAYEKAVQDAMESAALFGVILYSEDPKARTIVLKGETEITSKTMAAIPPGYKAAQISPNQPGNNHEAWKRSKLQQVLLPLGMPTVVGLLDSQNTSYAGGRIDLQNYSAITAVTQGELERSILNRLVEIAIREATLAGALPSKRPADLDWHWVWPAIPHVDPVKQAMSQRMRMQDATLDESGAAAEYGLDAEALHASRQSEQLANDRRLVERIVALNKLVQEARAADPTLDLQLPLLLAAAGAITAPGAFLQGASRLVMADNQGGTDPKQQSTQGAQDLIDAEDAAAGDAADQQRADHRKPTRRKHAA